MPNTLARGLVAVFVSGFLLAPSYLAQEPQSSGEKDVKGRPNPEILLERSYLMGGHFALEERCYQLFALSKAAAQIHTPRSDGFAEEWSKELFRQSFELPPSWNRAALEKNALEVLSSVKPHDAFNLLEKVDKIELDDKSKAPEDLRAFAAQKIFLKLWASEGPSSLPALRSVSRKIAESGEYPYIAMGEISKKLSERKDKDAVRSMFREALSFYEQGTHVRSSDPDFIKYIDQVWVDLPFDLRREGLAAIIKHLEQDERADPTKTEAVRVVTDKGSILFSKRKTALLYGILSKVRELDPDWAKQLEEKHSEFRQPAASGATQHTAGITVYSEGASSSQVSEAVATGLQQGILGEMKKRAETDPVAAADLLPSISNPQLQARALAMLAAAFKATDPKRSEQLFDAAQKQADEMSPSARKLEALAELAEAASSVKEYPRVAHEVTTALDLSDELLSQELDMNPGQPVFTSSVLESLSKLTQLGAQVAFTTTMPQVDKVRNDALHAYLLADVAEGLRKAETQQ